MVARRVGRVLAACCLLPLTFVGATGCSDSCDGVDCGGGVAIVWPRGQFSDAAASRTCVNDRCDQAVPLTRSSTRTGGGDGSDHEVSVRLELLDGSGTVIHALTGVGTKHGRCCPYVEFHPSKDGKSLVPS